MSIKALNQNLTSLEFAPNMDEQCSSHPFFPSHGEGDHPYPNPGSFQSGNGQAGNPGHPYASMLCQFTDVGLLNEANNEIGDASASRKPYPYPGPQGHYPPHHFTGQAQQPHTYRGPAEGRNRHASPWDCDKSKPYPYPGPADGHKPHPHPGQVPWRQPHPSPWEDDNKSKPSFPRQPYQFPGGSHGAGPFHQQPCRYPGSPQDGTSFPHQPYPFPSGQHGGHGNRGWGGRDSFGQASFGGPSFGGYGRGGFEAPNAPHGPWGSRQTMSQPPPYMFPSTASDKYTPEVDLFDTPEAFVLHVPLPGAKKEDIEVNWDPKTVVLNITGVISRPGSEDLVKMIVLDERKLGAFERKVRLGSTVNPPKVDGDAISARFEDGVLVVEVPKTEPDDVDVKKVEVE
ncbi:HSP20-like chaperone [Penicillium italicum]|uniref:HSP20-like chaperone n=1 Tax=Penicillium italicum TaxID=40296 RepID=A0A0A2L8Q5_PENIT|nr:HSP20-like chaperone [Penicillium italicum]